MKAYLGSDIGKTRQENQDSIRAESFPDGVLALVCDGMGGMQNGSAASKIAVAAAEERFCADYESGMPEEAVCELLRNCAACIRDVFAQGEGRQCFRFGGDEFSAFWVDVPRAEIEPTLERFAQEQQARGVSISVGWAHTEDFSGTSVTELYEEADRNMYDDKTEFHRKQAQEVLDWLKLTN